MISDRCGTVHKNAITNDPNPFKKIARNKCNIIETEPKLNNELLGYIIHKIKNCPITTTCPGDSGEIHCMLCKKCVLSTEELKGI